MSKRRVFLKVLGVGAAAIPVACGEDEGEQTGQGGSGGQGGAAMASSSSFGPITTTTTSGGSGGAPPENLVEIGLTQDFTFGALTGRPQLRLLVGYDAGGFYAMTSRCTHNNCDMLEFDKGEITSTGVNCSCHGSEFNLDGEVLQGPATQTLRHYYVWVSDNNRVYYDPDMQVDTMFRAPVPD